VPCARACSALYFPLLCVARSGHIPASNIQSVSVARDRPFTFHVHTKTGDRLFCFQCYSDAEVQGWVQAIEALIAGRTAQWEREQRTRQAQERAHRQTTKRNAKAAVSKPAVAVAQDPAPSHKEPFTNADAAPPTASSASALLPAVKPDAGATGEDIIERLLMGWNNSAAPKRVAPATVIATDVKASIPTTAAKANESATPAPAPLPTPTPAPAPASAASRAAAAPPPVFSATTSALTIHKPKAVAQPQFSAYDFTPASPGAVAIDFTPLSPASPTVPMPLAPRLPTTSPARNDALFAARVTDSPPLSAQTGRSVNHPLTLGGTAPAPAPAVAAVKRA
jgi:hypothetical protein